MLQIAVFAFLFMVILVDSAPLTDQNEGFLVKYTNEPLIAGSNLSEYKFEYETSDGKYREETGKLVKNKQGVEYLLVRGSFSYIGPDDVVYTVFYTADENGFQASGDHIPGKGEERPVQQIGDHVIKSMVG